ncbi:hypothetical protein T439DRAFT_381946 [Meredithblackwellia eburnea MCA 4105]
MGSCLSSNNNQNSQQTCGIPIGILIVIFIVALAKNADWGLLQFKKPNPMRMQQGRENCMDKLVKHGSFGMAFAAVVDGLAYGLIMAKGRPAVVCSGFAIITTYFQLTISQSTCKTDWMKYTCWAILIIVACLQLYVSFMSVCNGSQNYNGNQNYYNGGGQYQNALAKAEDGDPGGYGRRRTRGALAARARNSQKQWSGYSSASSSDVGEGDGSLTKEQAYALAKAPAHSKARSQGAALFADTAAAGNSNRTGRNSRNYEQDSVDSGMEHDNVSTIAYGRGGGRGRVSSEEAMRSIGHASSRRSREERRGRRSMSASRRSQEYGSGGGRERSRSRSRLRSRSRADMEQYDYASAV